MAIAITNYDVDLGSVYSFDYTDKATLVSDRYGSYASAIADLDAAGARWDQLGFSHSDFLGMYYTNAANLDALWKTSGLMGAGYNVVNNLSRARLFWPHGGYFVNYPCMVGYGQYIGKGSEQYTDNTGATPGTQLIQDSSSWLSTQAPVRNIVQSWNYGDTGVLGYTQGCTVKDIFVSGDATDYYDNAYESNGFAIWSAGSGSGFWRCRADKFNNDGFQFAYRPTPGMMIGCRAFFNNLGGASIIGAGRVFSYNFETDENPAAFRGRSGYGIADADAVCRFHSFGWKGETGTTSVIPKKGQCLLDSEAWTTCTFHGIDYTGANSYPELLCRVKSSTSNPSSITMSGLSTQGYFRTLIHDVANGKKFFLDRDMYAQKYQSGISQLHWSDVNGGNLYADSILTPHLDVPYENRQAWLAADGMTGDPVPPLWDDTVDPGTPAFVE